MGIGVSRFMVITAAGLLATVAVPAAAQASREDASREETSGAAVRELRRECERLRAEIAELKQQLQEQRREAAPPRGSGSGRVRGSVRPQGAGSKDGDARVEVIELDDVVEHGKVLRVGPTTVDLDHVVDLEDVKGGVTVLRVDGEGDGEARVFKVEAGKPIVLRARASDSDEDASGAAPRRRTWQAITTPGKAFRLHVDNGDADEVDAGGATKVRTYRVRGEGKSAGAEDSDASAGTVKVFRAGPVRLEVRTDDGEVRVLRTDRDGDAEDARAVETKPLRRARPRTRDPRIV